MQCKAELCGAGEGPSAGLRHLSRGRGPEDGQELKGLLCLKRLVPPRGPPSAIRPLANTHPFIHPSVHLHIHPATYPSMGGRITASRQSLRSNLQNLRICYLAGQRGIKVADEITAANQLILK